MMAGKPVREAPLIRRNALHPPIIGAMRKVAAVKKYSSRLVWARAGNSRSPLFAMAPITRKPQTTIIQAVISSATSNSRLWLFPILGGAGFMLKPNGQRSHARPVMPSRSQNVLEALAGASGWALVHQLSQMKWNCFASRPYANKRLAALLSISSSNRKIV
jgi:hypothetical protein